MKSLFSLFLVFFAFMAMSQYEVDTAKINRWNKLADSLARNVNKQAFIYADSALINSRKIKYKQGEGYALMYIGLAHDYAGTVESAFSYYDSAKVVFKKANYDKGVAQAISNIGVCYLIIGEHDKAVKYLLESLPYMKKSDYKKGTASVLNNLGLIARRKGDYLKALDYYQQSVDFKKELNDQRGLGLTYVNISSLYYYLEDFENSAKYNELGLKIASEIGDDKMFYENEVHRATLLSETGKNSQALTVFRNADPGLIEHGAYKSLVVSYVGQAEIHLMNKQPDSCINYFNNALEILDQIDVAQYRLEVLRGLSEAYLQKKDYKTSREYLDEYAQLKDEIYKNSRSDEVKELESKYNYLSQKDKIEQLRKDNEISTLKERRTRFIQWVLWVAAGVLLIILLIIVLFYRRLRRQKNKIDIALQDKELLLKEIHHRVKNNLQMVSSLLYLQADNIADKEALEAINLSRSRVESMAIIHQELYKEDDITGVETDKYISNLVDTIVDTMGVEVDNITIKKDIAPIVLDIDTMIPLGLILNELITNVFKHAFAEDQLNKELFIALKEIDKKLYLEMKDNGEGNPEANKAHSTGFGSRLIDLFLKKLKAEKSIEKENGYLVKLTIGNYILR